jgi:carbamoyltransferase
VIVLGFQGGLKREDETDPVSAAYHDGAAAILRNGEIVAALEEERLNRIKHSNCFPTRSIRHCLNECGIGLKDIDKIAVNMEERNANNMAKVSIIDDSAAHIYPNGRAYISSIFEKELAVDIQEKLVFCNHHLAHAWSAYAASGFEDSLVLSIDGGGDNQSGMVLVGEGRKLTAVRHYGMGQSLGLLYHHLICLLGYARFDEYKVMGLAPYGDPQRYAPLFQKCYELLPDGEYKLADTMTWYAQFDAAGLVQSARRKGKPFTQNHMDYAATLQNTLEQIVMHVLQYYRRKTNRRRLCLAGGVSHNCTLNGKILYSGLFDSVFVQPAAHDAGGALGAAWFAMFAEREPPQFSRMSHVYFGRDIGHRESIRKSLVSWGDLLNFEEVDQIAPRTAELLAGGDVIGWVQGRSEFGPRALGNRSILADPRPSANKDIINKMIKKREQYRPFAPSVLEEKAGEIFELPSTQTEFPFMIFVLNVKDSFRDQLGAITHVDGTARVQTVSRRTNPLYWELIHNFEKITGIPILLNTSFNNNAEPIVDSVDDAITCFLTTEINYLVIDHFLVRKAGSAATGLGKLILDFPAHRKLVKRKVRDATTGDFNAAFEIECTKSRFFGPTAVQISHELFSLLNLADGKKSINTLFKEAELGDIANATSLIKELIKPWTQRLITLRPASA